MKNLPKIAHVTFDIIVPSTEKKVTFRPFTVQEEKLLLTAASANDTKYVVENIKRVIQNCAESETFDVENLTTFDLEFVFANLRGRSVGSLIDITVEENGETFKGKLNIEDLKVIKNPEHTDKIQLNETIGVTMKYPKFEEAIKLSDEKEEAIFDLIKSSISTIYDSESVFVKGDDFNEKELEKFIMDLPSSAFKKLAFFFETMPFVKADVKLTDSKGNVKDFELRGLQQLFQ